MSKAFKILSDILMCNKFSKEAMGREKSPSSHGWSGHTMARPAVTPVCQSWTQPLRRHFMPVRKQSSKYAWDKLKDLILESGLDNMGMSPHSALEASPKRQITRPSCASGVISCMQSTESPDTGLMKIKRAGCAHRAAWQERGTHAPLGTLSNLQPSTSNPGTEL